MDKVTVIIPSYNHADYIDEAIESCLNQSYEGIVDIIVVDDFSTDSTRKVLEKYTNYNMDNRSIKILYKSVNKGINDSIELGVKCSEGSYVQILASDDVICRDKIKRQIEFLEENSNFDCVYSRGYIYDGNKKTEYFLEDFKKYYALGKGLEFVSKQDWGAPLAQSGLFSIELLKDLIRIRNDFKSDDWAMLIVALKYYSVGYYDIPCFLYRNHDDNTYKKYWRTFPMRVDVASRLVDEKYREKAISNIMISQSEYLWRDGERLKSMKFFLASNFISLNFNSFFILAKLVLSIKFFRCFKILRK
ncbi:glycosyltransferase family 2 protein [Marinomonas posidonica]|uniref:glycosyltransferase family 2 protein n=1 Tax=Marinomonas posidonica TaxID=936476 RepID=UPI003735FE2C